MTDSRATILLWRQITNAAINPIGMSLDPQFAAKSTPQRAWVQTLRRSRHLAEELSAGAMSNYMILHILFVAASFYPTSYPTFIGACMPQYNRTWLQTRRNW
jgi:hypothetical protein